MTPTQLKAMLTMDCNMQHSQADAELSHAWLKDVATLQRHERDLFA